MAASTQAHDWAITQLQPLFRSLGHQVRVQTAATASKGNQRGDVQIQGYLKHNGVERDLVYDLSVTHERWGATRSRSTDLEVVYFDMTDWSRIGRAPDFSEGRS
jgi:hypothetical protein